MNFRDDLPKDEDGKDLVRCRKKKKGENDVWQTLDYAKKNRVIAQSAHIRAVQFNSQIPLDFARAWPQQRLFEQKHGLFSSPLAPTRQYCIELFTDKINATINNTGDVDEGNSNNNTAGTIAAKAKQSLLRFIPLMLPMADDNPNLYRLVLEHGDFGIHNMSIEMTSDELPVVTSIENWEIGCIVPAILSDPSMSVNVDLVLDRRAAPSITRVDRDATRGNRAQYMQLATHYFQHLFDRAPAYKQAIKAGKDARHLWFALRDWKGDDPNRFFGDLGAWAEKRMKEVSGSS